MVRFIALLQKTPSSNQHDPLLNPPPEDEEKQYDVFSLFFFLAFFFFNKSILTLIDFIRQKVFSARALCS
jgi:hypothetical protein